MSHGDRIDAQAKEASHAMKINPEVTTLINEVTASLVSGKKITVEGLGTFSSCTRKATATRDACTIAMFRADKSLRTHIDTQAELSVSGAHAEAVTTIIQAMQQTGGVDVPDFGHFEAVAVSGKPHKLIFHADAVLNDKLG